MRRFAPRLFVVSSFLIGLLFVASLVVVSLVAGTSSASPAMRNGQGAVQGPTNGQIDIHNCEDDGTVTFCYIAQGEYHSVCTPAGECNTQQNLRSQCFTVNK